MTFALSLSKIWFTFQLFYTRFGCVVALCGLLFLNFPEMQPDKKKFGKNIDNTIIKQERLVLQLSFVLQFNVSNAD
jgi:hypothetical protein